MNHLVEATQQVDGILGEVEFVLVNFDFAAVVSSFAVSLICSYAPVISGFSSGTRVLILTLIIASFFAFFFPVKNAPQSQKGSGSEDRKEDTAQ